MANVYYEKDCDLSLISDRKIAVIGYGSQGHAHALNLHDSGCDVRVGLRASSASWDKVKADGLKVMTPREAAQEADIIMMLTPDETQAHTYYSEIHESMSEGKVLAFAHGFNIHYGQIEPPAPAHHHRGEVLWEIQNGEFARNWILENRAGSPGFKAMRRIQAEHLIEEVGGDLRGMFSWLAEKE
jgi:ketol-acid reductoisomerase